LGDSQVLSHLDDSFFGLLDNCRTKGWSFSYFWPH
jgi:hypothetical protein